MEFILIFAFSMIIVIPLVSVMHSQYAQSKEDLDESQAKQVIDEIGIAMQNTFYAGYPSRTTLLVFFPDGITNISTLQNKDGSKSALLFKVKRGNTESELSHSFPFPITTDIEVSEGKRKILIKAEQAGYVNVTEIT